MPALRLALRLALILALPLAGCGGQDEEAVPESTSEPFTAEPETAGPPDTAARRARIDAAVADPLRPEEDRARDADRLPGEVLAFFGIDEGMRVLDIQGTRGYYTEILSTLVGPDGAVVVQNNPFVLERFAGEPLAQRLAKLEQAGRTNITRLDAELDEMEPAGGFDAALMIRFYHDLFWLPKPDGRQADRSAFLRRVYDALKPGGVFGVVDHHAEEGSFERDAVEGDNNLHRIDVGLVRAEVQLAGFVLDDQSDVLANPADTRDWNIFSEGRRDTTDRFVLRFIKP